MSVVAYKPLRQASLSVVKPPAAADTVAIAWSTGSGAGVVVAVGDSKAVSSVSHPTAAATSASIATAPARETTVLFSCYAPRVV